MSTIRTNGQKIILPRCGVDEQWELIIRHHAQADPRKWKYLAMLALKENAGWPLDCIGNVFEHPKGHVSRCIARTKQELRDRFQTSELAGLCDPDDSEQLAA